ncbi:PIG-L deacetylase family protein [Oceanobacillus sojae]|uniref:PIG-L deacetylase family protein n=2 Tax=Oceanobacillus sojae TaxID=582851 RepID=UPI003F7441B3
MLGRNISEDLHRSTDILVIAAHPDDEILGLGATLHRHRKDGDKIMVTYVTNGTAGEGASWKTKVNDSKIIAEVRFNEGLKGLKLLDILERNILCLGYPDAGTHRYLKNIARDLNKLIKKTKPKRIYVHCIEGGHSDHDITSFVVKSVCKKLKFDNVFEWAEYNQIQPLGTRNINFANSDLFFMYFYNLFKINSISFQEFSSKLDKCIEEAILFLQKRNNINIREKNFYRKLFYLEYIALAFEFNINIFHGSQRRIEEELDYFYEFFKMFEDAENNITPLNPEVGNNLYVKEKSVI